MNWINNQIAHHFLGFLAIIVFFTFKGYSYISLVCQHWIIDACLVLLKTPSPQIHQKPIKERERGMDLSHWASTLPTELQPDSHCDSAKPMVSLCPSIRLPPSTRHCLLCAQQPRTNYCFSYLPWDSVDCTGPTNNSALS